MKDQVTQEEPEFKPMAPADLTPCSKCKGPIVPIFYRVTIEQIGIDSNSVQQVQGLGMMLGNRPDLALYMGAGIQAATLQRFTGKFCLQCQNEILHLMGILGGE